MYVDQKNELLSMEQALGRWVWSSRYPNEVIRTCTEFLPTNELLGLRLVSRKWMIAVADRVECLLDTAIGSLDWNRWLTKGHWPPPSQRQLRMVLCCIRR